MGYQATTTKCWPDKPLQSNFGVSNAQKNYFDNSVWKKHAKTVSATGAIMGTSTALLPLQAKGGFDWSQGPAVSHTTTRLAHVCHWKILEDIPRGNLGVSKGSLSWAVSKRRSKSRSAVLHGCLSWLWSHITHPLVICLHRPLERSVFICYLINDVNQPWRPWQYSIPIPTPKPCSSR